MQKTDVDASLADEDDDEGGEVGVEERAAAGGAWVRGEVVAAAVAVGG